MSHTPEHTEGEYKANQDQSPVDCAAKGKKPWDISSQLALQWFKAYTVRHNGVLYLLVKTVMQSLGLTPLRELKGPGGTLKPGVYGTK